MDFNIWFERNFHWNNIKITLTFFISTIKTGNLFAYIKLTWSKVMCLCSREESITDSFHSWPCVLAFLNVIVTCVIIFLILALHFFSPTEACKLMSNITCSIPEFTCVPSAKVGWTLYFIVAELFFPFTIEFLNGQMTNSICSWWSCLSWERPIILSFAR